MGELFPLLSFPHLLLKVTVRLTSGLGLLPVTCRLWPPFLRTSHISPPELSALSLRVLSAPVWNSRGPETWMLAEHTSLFLRPPLVSRSLSWSQDLLAEQTEQPVFSADSPTQCHGPFHRPATLSQSVFCCE